MTLKGKELSPRQLEILGLVREGYSDAKIASGLGFAPQTIKDHMGRIIRKLGTTNRTGAVITAIRRGLIPLNPSRCEWCSIPVTDNNLYNWTGYETLAGPICKKCVNDLKKSPSKTQILQEARK